MELVFLHLSLACKYNNCIYKNKKYSSLIIVMYKMCVHVNHTEKNDVI